MINLKYLYSNPKNMLTSKMSCFLEVTSVFAYFYLFNSIVPSMVYYEYFLLSRGPKNTCCFNRKSRRTRNKQFSIQRLVSVRDASKKSIMTCAFPLKDPIVAGRHGFHARITFYYVALESEFSMELQTIVQA